mmetsp:Transcript_57377/g.135033  ORF Transcript_57377/g.135033 Transcript_57377/m.135033 type:complete len:211 (-) Transcript_57377:1237-1869(-)
MRWSQGAVKRCSWIFECQNNRAPYSGSTLSKKIPCSRTFWRLSGASDIRYFSRVPLLRSILTIPRLPVECLTHWPRRSCSPWTKSPSSIFSKSCATPATDTGESSSSFLRHSVSLGFLLRKSAPSPACGRVPTFTTSTRKSRCSMSTSCSRPSTACYSTPSVFTASIVYAVSSKCRASGLWCSSRRCWRPCACHCPCRRTSQTTQRSKDW